MADEPTQAQVPETPDLTSPPDLAGAPDLTSAPAPDPVVPETADDLAAAPDEFVSEDFEPESERPTTRKPSLAYTALPWVLAAIVVLLLAASGGLISAWLVASMHAVPAPALADVTPTPVLPVSGEPSAAPTEVSGEQPRHTPTPSPVVTQEPAPFVHIVQRGENLSYIADLYGVTVDDIVALNNITNPKLRIFPGQELLIPGYGHQPSPSPG